MDLIVQNTSTTVGINKSIYEGYYKADFAEWGKITAVDKARHIIAMCGEFEHQKIIEVGAGDGAVLNELSINNFSDNMYALEIAESAVQALRKREINGLKESRNFDGNVMPYADKAFDLAIASHVLEHVEHPRLFLKELSRVAKQVFIEIPLENSFQGRRDSVNAIKYGHINYFNPFLIEKLLKSVGMSIAKKTIVDFSPEVYKYRSGFIGIAKYAIRGLMLRSFPRCATKLFSYCYCVLCS